MAALTQRRYAVATVNGTAALHLTLLTLGVRPGDFVAVPDWTFAATANAVRHAGATPVFVDIDPATWCLDPTLIPQARAAAGGRLAAIIAVHVLGQPADMDRIRLAAEATPLVEDAAGAIGALYKGRPAGALSDAAIFSFNGNKTVTAGGGGMIVTDSKELADAARHLSTQARRTTSYEHDAVGFNYRMTNLNAAVGVAQLERLDAMLAAKRAIAARYDAAFSENPHFTLMPRASWATSGCWLYSLRCADNETADSLVAYLREEKTEARIFWRALSRQPAWRGAPQVSAGVSDSLSGTVVSLPCSSSLIETDQQHVIQAVQRWSAARTPQLARA